MYKLKLNGLVRSRLFTPYHTFASSQFYSSIANVDSDCLTNSRFCTSLLKDELRQGSLLLR